MLDARPLLALTLLLASATPVAAAPPPEAPDGAALVVGWELWNVEGPVCDPQAPVANPVQGSHATHRRLDGTTRLDLTLLAHALGGVCKQIELTLDADVDAWQDQQSLVDLTGPCGLVGWLFVSSGSRGTNLYAGFDAPPACGLPVVGYTSLAVALQPLQAAPLRACYNTGFLIPPCLTVHDHEQTEGPTCSDGTRSGRTELGLVVIRRSCAATDQDTVYVEPTLRRTVWLEAREGECLVRAREIVFIGIDETLQCPPETWGALWLVKWGRILP